MAWQLLAWPWMANAAAGGLMVLAVGALAVRLCPQPARRSRLIVMTILGATALPALMAIPGAPRWSARVLPTMRAAGVLEGASRGPGAPSATVEPLARESIGNTTGAGPGIAGPTPRWSDRIGLVAERAVAPAPPAPPARAIPWSVLVTGLYLAASAGLAAWWLIGQLLLWRVTRGARPVPQAVRQRFLALSGPAGERVRLLVSDRIALPFTYTWSAPVILLPGDLCAPGDAAALRYALAHEWSHVERRDAWAWNLAAAAAAVLFYQPLFWWLRRQLRLSQDYLADDRAAAAGSPEDYAAYLVRLARAHRSGCALPALGVGDRRSNLYRRIALLVQDREPWERRCRTAWSLAVGLAAVVVIAAASALRLDAAPPRSERPADDSARGATKAPAAPAAKAGEGKTYVGLVSDKDTGQPIAGASVLVRLSLFNDPKTGTRRTLEEIRQKTDAEGRYRFTISPEQMAERSLFVYLDVDHPGYVKEYGGYGYGMIARNEKLGARPFYENLRLRPGKAVEARLLNPEGAPVAGVQINAFCTNPEAKRKDPNEWGAFTWTSTDADGRFRLDLFPSGPAVVWISPRDYAPSTHVLKNGTRGDLGAIVLEKGNTIEGQAFDAQGKPVAGAYVVADRDRTKELEQEAELRFAADHVVRTVVTGADGRFTICALPAGNYRVALVEEGRDPATRRDVEDMPRRPLPGVFTPRRLTVKDGETPEPVVIRGVPHVVVEARIHDSQGNRTKGHEIDLVGKIDGDYWSTSVPHNADGVYTLLAPHGLAGAQVSLVTNEHTVLRHRLSKDAPLSNSRFLRLGALDHDIKGIEIIRYAAPIIVVKVATQDGMKPADVVVWADYTPKKKDQGGRRVLKGGVTSDCRFEQQEDGRFRSDGLYPDQEVTVTARAKGYAERTSPAFSLAEGTTREIELVLEKKP
jgi:beta-lactamase regulating signal transducer with metallopeptidase domain